MDVAGLFGAPRAVAHWDRLYEFVTKKHGLAARVVLEGMSRGGLIIYQWARKNPRKVACIYADAPVCDFRSWPGGRGKGAGHAASWKACLAAYGLSEEEGAQYEDQPINRLRELARHGVALLHVCGDADQVVPHDENTTLLARHYRRIGGSIQVILKEGVGHHPHSLKDPTPIVNFVLRHTLERRSYIQMRAGLTASSQRLRAGGERRVAFLGGSITHNPGWRDLVCADLRARYPRTKFTFINAGIPSMGSTPGAFRLHRDVLSHGAVDLLFVEAAVNDSTNGRSLSEMLRGMEGIVRHVRREQPQADILMLHFVDPDKMACYRDGRTPEVIAQHERVAAHYGVPSLDLAREVTDRIAYREFTWKEDFKNLHPSPFGQQLYFRSIQRVLDRAHAEPVPTAPRDPKLPKALDRHSYSRGRLVSIDHTDLALGWDIDQNWKPTDGAGVRRGFTGVPMLIGDAATGTALRSFEGTAIGVFVAAGPDAGVLRYRVDDGEWRDLDLFTRWSRRLHLPWAHVLTTGLAPGTHHLELRVAQAKHRASSGRVVRIAHFLIDG